MAEEVKKLVSLDILDYYDDLNKTWTLSKLAEVSGLTEEEVRKIVIDEIQESTKLEII